VIGVNRTGANFLPYEAAPPPIHSIPKISTSIQQSRNNGTVGNQTSNRHGIVGYLNDRNIARVVCEGSG
jgi:hypothetical protein